jgi:hypothetical protein
MKPTHWRLTWQNPLTKTTHSRNYTQRCVARGDAMIQRAQGMLNVHLVPVFA